MSTLTAATRYGVVLVRIALGTVAAFLGVAFLALGIVGVLSVVASILGGAPGAGD